LTGPRNKDSGLRNGNWGQGSGVARGANWADRRASGQQQGATALVDVEMACHWHSKRKRKHSPRFPLEQQGAGWQALRNSIRQMSGHMNVGVRVYRMARYKSAGQVKGKGKSQRHLTLHMPGSG